MPFIGFTGAPLYRLNGRKLGRHLNRSAKLRNLKNNKFYLSLYFEKRWDQPIEDIQNELGLNDYKY